MISSEYLESNIEKNFSSYESRKKAISDLKTIIKKESSLIDDSVIKAPIKETISKRCELNDDVIHFVANQFFIMMNQNLTLLLLAVMAEVSFTQNLILTYLFFLKRTPKMILKIIFQNS